MFNFADCGIYTCFILHVVHVLAFASLRGFLHFILQFACFCFSFFQIHTSLIWVLLGAVLMYVFLHSMLAYGFLAFLFLHAYYLSGFWLLFLWCFYVCFVACMLFFNFVVLDDVWFRVGGTSVVLFWCCFHVCFLTCMLAFLCVERGFGFLLSLSCFYFDGDFVVFFFAVLWHVLQTR